MAESGYSLRSKSAQQFAYRCFFCKERFNDSALKLSNVADAYELPQMLEMLDELAAQKAKSGKTSLRSKSLQAQPTEQKEPTKQGVESVAASNVELSSQVPGEI